MWSQAVETAERGPVLDLDRRRLIHWCLEEQIKREKIWSDKVHACKKGFLHMVRVMGLGLNSYSYMLPTVDTDQAGLSMHIWILNSCRRLMDKHMNLVSSYH